MRYPIRLSMVSHSNLIGCLLTIPELSGLEASGGYCTSLSDFKTGGEVDYKLYLGPYQFRWSHNIIQEHVSPSASPDYADLLLEILACGGLDVVFDDNPLYQPLAFDILNGDDPVDALSRTLSKHVSKCLRENWFLAESSYDFSFEPHLRGVATHPMFYIKKPDGTCFGKFSSAGNKFDYHKTHKLTLSCCSKQVSRESVVISCLDPLLSNLPICSRIEECKNACMQSQDS